MVKALQDQTQAFRHVANAIEGLVEARRDEYIPELAREIVDGARSSTYQLEEYYTQDRRY